MAAYLQERKNRMSIQWFPGHMNAARKKAAEAMEKVDLVIEVLDGRLPQASCNPMIEQLRVFRQRPCLKILNKSDLADPAVTAAWLAYYNAQKNVNAVALSCKKPSDVARIPKLCLALAPHRGTALKPLRMMIMGIPNVGKSTLMNALLKKRVAAVGDEPAVTKVQQRLYLNNNMVLIDTPGMLWPKIALPSDGLMLAASHAIGVNALIEEEVATYLGEQLLRRYPELLKARYGLDVAAEGMDGVAVVEGVAKRRGFLLRGGMVDLEKAAHMLLQDYRTGALGRISLETPQSRAALIAEYEAGRAQEQQTREEQAGEADRADRDYLDNRDD
jgi:ribosome biogenesis GTPase A